MHTFETYAVIFLIGFLVGGIFCALLFKSNVHQRAEQLEESLKTEIKTIEGTIHAKILSSEERLANVFHLGDREAPKQVTQPGAPVAAAGADTSSGVGEPPSPTPGTTGTNA